jgi:hypothetical protein
LLVSVTAAPVEPISVDGVALELAAAAPADDTACGGDLAVSGAFLGEKISLVTGLNGSPRRKNDRFQARHVGMDENDTSPLSVLAVTRLSPLQASGCAMGHTWEVKPSAILWTNRS